MSTRSAQWIALAVVSVILVGAVIANQLKVHRGRQARAAVVEQRHALFELIQPVALANCRLERFGEPHDGGYLMCGNLLEQVQSGYSYGLHFNNASCADGIAPFPAWAYELLLVNKRLAVVDPSRKPMLPHPLDAPTDPSQPDCQAAGGGRSAALRVVRTEARRIPGITAAGVPREQRIRVSTSPPKSLMARAGSRMVGGF